MANGDTHAARGGAVMVSAITYAHAVLWACLPPVLFAVVSDRAGMSRRDRTAVLRVLWCLPLALSALAITCAVLLLIAP